MVVERIVTDIDAIVRLVRFPGWQNTKAGEREVQKALRKVIYVKYQVKDQDLFDKASDISGSTTEKGREWGSMAKTGHLRRLERKTATD